MTYQTHEGIIREGLLSSRAAVHLIVIRWRERKTFCTLAILCLLALLGVGSYLVIPSYRARRLQSNEMGTSRVLNILAVKFKNRFFSRNPTGESRNSYAVADLEDLLADDPAGFPGLAQADSSNGRRLPGIPVPYHGYFFRILSPTPGAALPDPSQDGFFVIVAYPADYEVTGRKTHCVNGLGYYRIDNGGICPVQAPTLESLRLGGWAIVD